MLRGGVKRSLADIWDGHDSETVTVAWAYQLSSLCWRRLSAKQFCYNILLGIPSK